MNTTQIQKKDGFTIIEVVLVLAIAALMMLLVFLAWPSLQRGQRDQARKNDVSAIGSTIGTHKSNYKGKLPELNKLREYMENQGMSQYEASTDITAAGSPGTPASTGQGPMTDVDKIRYVPGHKCKDDGGTQRAGGRQAAIQFMVEADGNNLAQCQDV
jgi:prepilin-type N-terminal cleavage/methylation domain-containing protein